MHPSSRFGRPLPTTEEELLEEQRAFLERKETPAAKALRKEKRTNVEDDDEKEEEEEEEEDDCEQQQQHEQRRDTVRGGRSVAENCGAGHVDGDSNTANEERRWERNERFSESGASVEGRRRW